MFRNPLALAAILALQAAAFDAGAICTAGNGGSNLDESTPDGALVDHGDGTVTHTLTGLMWKKCSQGQAGPGCASGAPSALTWRAALASAATDGTGGYSDWRLPNKKELESIVESCGYVPAINQTRFPGTPSLYYWTSTTYVAAPNNAWFVNFSAGYSSNYLKSTGFAARLVRGGQAFDAYYAVQLQVVIEYLNTADFPNSPGGHFFYSSDPAEQAAVDSGAAGQFARTGRQFSTGGTHPVCRFYGSMSPGPNSHFFTVEVDECNALRAAQVTPAPATEQQWNYEGIAYATTPATVAANGAQSCPSNTLPLYRAYNNAYPVSGPKNAWDSNHRLTPLATDIATMVAAGWRDEGIVFCTAR